MIYCSPAVKCLGLFRATWEAYIQRCNNCTTLSIANNAHVNTVRHLQSEANDCLTELRIVNEDFHHHAENKKNNW